MFRSVLPVTGLMVSTFFLLAGSGLTGVLLPIRAGIEGWTAITIGWIGFGYALCFTAGCFIVPRLVRRVGHVRVYAVLATMLAMAMLLHALFVHPLAWIAFRGIAGFSLAGAYMVVESWLNEKATNETRGQIFSFYMIMNMVGLMAGQFMLIIASPATATLFICAALLYSMAVIPTGLSNATSPQPLTQVRVNFTKLYANSPAAVVGMFLAGTIAGAWNFQAAVYAQSIGMSGNQIPFLLAIAMIGGAIFQYPIGYASDRMDRRIVMIFAGIAGLSLSIVAQLVPGAAAPTLIFIIMFLFGAVLFPIYSLVVAHANDYAQPSEFVEISSGLLVINGIGAMIGPVVAGFLINAMGSNGFFTTMAVCYAAFGGFAAWRMTRREAVDLDEMTDFTFLHGTRSPTPETLNLDPRSEEI